MPGRLAPPPGFRFPPPDHPFRCPVAGSCLEPIVFDGDHVVVNPRLAPQPGDVVVAEVWGRGLLCKLLTARAGALVLVAPNDPTIAFPVDGLVNIVGVVSSIVIPIPDPHRARRPRLEDQYRSRPPDDPPAA
jgi:SOS-response transcriptional repressor LexA